ncbi:MAG: hypothetical protein QM492_11745 [Rhodobacterales bacterium]
MNYLDTRIDELMTKTDAHLLRSSQPLGWFGLSRYMRNGRMKRVVWTVDIVHLILLALGCVTALRFFAANDVLTAVKYGISSAVLLIVSFQFKLSLMPHLQAERILREIKRVEILALAKNHKPGADDK